MVEFEQICLMQVLMKKFAIRKIRESRKDDGKKRKEEKQTEFWNKPEQRLKVLTGR